MTRWRTCCPARPSSPAWGAEVAGAVTTVTPRTPECPAGSEQQQPRCEIPKNQETLSMSGCVAPGSGVSWSWLGFIFVFFFLLNMKDPFLGHCSTATAPEQ